MTIRRVLAALVCAVLPVLAGPLAGTERATPHPPPIPDTPAGKRFAELMALTDAGDEAGVSAYVRDHFTQGMQRTVPGDPGIFPFLVEHAKRGGFEVVRVVSSHGEQVTMLVRPRSGPGRWLRYVVKVEGSPPHRVEGLFLMPAGQDDIPTDSEVTAEQAVAALAKEVDRLIASDGFSGVVLLAKNGEIALQRAAGEADREHHVPVKPETVFSLASMNKMFTAVAIGRLVEQGRIAWEDPVGQHLRGWLPEERARTITIHQLLTHTSGLGDYLDRIADDPRIRSARTLSAYRDLVRAAPVERLPRDELRYSNLGYVVLGALIETVTGRSYFDFVREEIFDRAGMKSTGSWSVDEVIENRAESYLRPPEAETLGMGHGWRSNVLLRGARGTSAGGGWSTAGDLFRFARALVENRIVKRETLEAILRPRVRFPFGGDYAYGFVVHARRDGSRVFGHAGGFPGVNGEIKIHGDGAWTLVVLSNVSGGAGEIVGAWDGIAARLAPAR